MKRTLKNIFDYQRFSPNANLSTIIEQTENKYKAIEDDDLLFVNAAGEVNSNLMKKDNDSINK